MEILKDIFMICLYLTGITALISIIITFIDTMISKKAAKKKVLEAKENLNKSLDALTGMMSDFIIEELEKEEAKSNKKKSTKK